MTLRDALVHSLNVATVKVAEAVGYQRVVDFCQRMRLKSDLKPTPALALGAYEVAPLDIVAAYSALACSGMRSEPMALAQVVSQEGYLLQDTEVRRRSVLDPRIAYIVTNILEDVLNRGSGAGIGWHGFYAPASGKTGTSHDGWFVGYTSNLLCAVWVGFDNNRQLGLSGAASAGPIWAEFMKNAVRLPGFSNAQEFERPERVISVAIDPDTRQLAARGCPVVRQEVFIAGTEPTKTCTLHGGNFLERIAPASWLKKLFHRR